jgi:hypothetical protein
MLPALEFMAIAAPPVDAATGLFTLIRIVPDAVAESGARDRRSFIACAF